MYKVKELFKKTYVTILLICSDRWLRFVWLFHLSI